MNVKDSECNKRTGAHNMKQISKDQFTHNSTHWYNENNELILEDIAYRRTFKKGQEVLIKSKTYEVIRHNISTNNNMDIFVKEVMRPSRTRLSTDKYD